MRTANNSPIEGEEILLKKYVYLVKSTCSRFRPTHIENREDMYSAGLLGLLNAIRTYNPEKGSIVSWNILKIRGYVIEYLRTEDRDIRPIGYALRNGPKIFKAKEKITIMKGASATVEEIQSITGLSANMIKESEKYDYMCFAESMTDERNGEYDIASGTFNVDTRIDLESRLNLIPERERNYIHHYINEGKTYMEIANMYGISECRAHQIVKKGLSRLKQHLQGAGYD